MLPARWALTNLSELIQAQAALPPLLREYASAFLESGAQAQQDKQQVWRIIQQSAAFPSLIASLCAPNREHAIHAMVEAHLNRLDELQALIDGAQPVPRIAPASGQHKAVG